MAEWTMASDRLGTGCLGPCWAVRRGDRQVFYESFARRMSRTCGRHLGRGRVVERLTHKRPDGRAVPNMADMDFFKRQQKIVLRPTAAPSIRNASKTTSATTAIRPWAECLPPTTRRR